MSAMAGRVDPRAADAPTPTGLAISARGLMKSYHGRPALAGVDLDVERGVVLGLLGPNGAGKTTLIRILSTVIAADAGSFSVLDQPHTRPKQVRRRIGVLPESAGYPPAQTCTEWLTLHARLFGATRTDARRTAARLLDEVGLGARANSLITGLSRGMRQRLGIARALVNDPGCVFLDEPTLGLDPAGQRQVLELITEVAREHGGTVVLSTHLLDEVEQICDRVVILNRGGIVADGTVAAVRQRAAAPRRGVLQVPGALRERSLLVLRAENLPAAPVGPAGAARSDVELQLPGDEPPEESSRRALSRLLEAGIPVLGFTLEGGRLNDAFLAVTGSERDE